LECDSTCAKAHRGLGLAALQLKEYEIAIEELNKYLASGGIISDRRFIQSKLERIPHAK
jgi:hypothetical protein